MNLLIFDMDKTITPPRSTMLPDMAITLCQILQFDKVIIVSGSDIDYMSNQLDPLISSLPNEDSWKLSIMPCNGTKQYAIESGSIYELKSFESDMVSQLGENDYKNLIRILLQTHISTLSNGLMNGIPVTGTFLQYRNTTINYCPIGRDSNSKNRAKFVSIDKSKYIREQLLYQLEQSLFMMNLNNQVEIVMGGETSLDIYPRGWDKTLALKDVNPMKYGSIYFFGDNCNKGQNDHSIYKAVGDLHNGRSFWVKNSEETEQILLEYFKSTYQG